jgi:hypothetical protein
MSLRGDGEVWDHAGVAPSLVSPVLVGRQAELGLLGSSLGRAVAGEQSTVLAAVRPASASRDSCTT